MANGFSPQMFSEGAERFDSNPYVNFYAQTMARKQAKDEALDQYHQNLFKQVNPAGARTQDIPLFTEKVNEWQKFYQQNRDKIRNPRLDGGRAATEFQSRYTDAQNYIQQSKNEAKAYQDIVPLLRDPEKRSRLPESVINDLAAHDLSLNDPKRKSFNLASVDFDPKPFDVAAQKNFLQGVQSGLKMDEEISGISRNPKSFTQTVTTTSAFGEDAKNAIRNRASGAYGSDPSFKHFVDTELSKPQNYQRLNEVFKKTYGKDIVEAEDLAAAYTLGSLQEEQVKQKTEADWKAREDYRHRHQLDLLARREAAKKTGQQEYDSWVLEFEDSLKQDALASNEPLSGLSGRRVNEIPISAFLGTALKRDGKEPDGLRVLENGQYMPIFYKRDENESIVRNEQGVAEMNQTLSKPISRKQFLLDLGYRGQTKKELGSTMQSKQPQQSQQSFKVNGKSYSQKELLGMGYSEQEIKEAVKAGLIQQ